MRARFFFSVLLLLASFLPLLVTAQTPPYVNHLSVRENGSTIEVEIHTTGKVASPNTQAITGPDRIVVDFPGALPASELHTLKVNRGPLKTIRSGLFFHNPPITRIVLDLTSAQTYQIAQTPNGVVVKLGATARPAGIAVAPSASATLGGARLTTVARVREAPVPTATLAVSPAAPANVPPLPPDPPKPVMTVSFQNGMLRIHAEKATLADVLFEVEQQTHAEIVIPSGAEQEQVIADLGPAPVRDVLAALLNGSSYNFIFVGNEQGDGVGKVILSRRDPNF